jgi:hypothetical protein
MTRRSYTAGRPSGLKVKIYEHTNEPDDLSSGSLSV